MNRSLAAAMRRALASTRASDIAKATRVIQDALAGPTFVADDASRSAGQGSMPPLIDPGADIGGPSAAPEISSPPKAPNARRAGEASQRLRKPLAEALQALREGLPGARAPGIKRQSPPAIPEGARFLTRSFSCPAGTRNYKLYIPAAAPACPQGLVVMLHGCKQDPDDFAAGTSMNKVAETNGLAVAYPGQSSSANSSSCWNWFSPADQTRGAGEPSIIAGITRELMSEFGLDRSQTFVAGLSAGGAMAAVMGETYPDLYAAVGIHSGLAYGSANDVVSAFAAMRGDVVFSPAKRRPEVEAGARVRTIVFQGSADQMVHPSNAARIAGAASGHAGSGAPEQRAGSAGGRNYRRMVVAGSDGAPVVECWLVDGAGHAWTGGHPSGSYTDPKGPDASREMARFFLNRPA